LEIQLADARQELQRLPLLLSENPQVMVPQLCREFAQRIAERISNINNDINMFNYTISQSNNLSVNFISLFNFVFTAVANPPLDGPDGIFTSTSKFTNAG
jgi:hypothetical protein